VVDKTAVKADTIDTAETNEIGGSDEEVRPKRADAVRNRERILRAAQEVFASEGLAVPIDVVAERAGVGVGTLYRNFPTKAALFEAIVSATLQDMVQRAKACADAKDPGPAFFSFLEEFLTHAVQKRDLRDALDAEGIDLKSRFAPVIEDLGKQMEKLLERAVAAGQVRSDVNTQEVIGLISGACHAADSMGLDSKSCLRLGRVVCDGLRPTN
jgi:AcrR family transcriptional regulator